VRRETHGRGVVRRPRGNQQTGMGENGIGIRAACPCAARRYIGRRYMLRPSWCYGKVLAAYARRMVSQVRVSVARPLLPSGRRRREAGAKRSAAAAARGRRRKQPANQASSPLALRQRQRLVLKSAHCARHAQVVCRAAPRAAVAQCHRQGSAWPCHGMPAMFPVPLPVHIHRLPAGCPAEWRKGVITC